MKPAGRYSVVNRLCQQKLWSFEQEEYKDAGVLFCFHGGGSMFAAFCSRQVIGSRPSFQTGTLMDGDPITNQRSRARIPAKQDSQMK